MVSHARMCVHTHNMILGVAAVHIQGSQTPLCSSCGSADPTQGGPGVVQPTDKGRIRHPYLHSQRLHEGLLFRQCGWRLPHSAPAGYAVVLQYSTTENA